MNQKLFELNVENLAEINKLLAEGYSLGATYHNSGTTFVQVYKYNPPQISGGIVHPYGYNGGF